LLCLFSILFDFDLLCDIQVEMFFFNLKELVFQISFVFNLQVNISDLCMNKLHNLCKCILLNTIFVCFNEVHIQEHGQILWTLDINLHLLHIQKFLKSLGIGLVGNLSIKFEHTEMIFIIIIHISILWMAASLRISA